MRQYSLFTDDPLEFVALVDSIRDEPFYQNASDRLLLIASQESGGPSLHHRVDKLIHALPGVKLAGLTMSGFLLPAEHRA